MLNKGQLNHDKKLHQTRDIGCHCETPNGGVAISLTIDD